MSFRPQNKAFLKINVMESAFSWKKKKEIKKMLIMLPQYKPLVVNLRAILKAFGQKRLLFKML